MNRSARAPDGTSATMPTVDQMTKRVEICASDNPLSANSSE